MKTNKILILGWLGGGILIIGIILIFLQSNIFSAFSNPPTRRTSTPTSLPHPTTDATDASGPLVTSTEAIEQSYYSNQIVFVSDRDCPTGDHLCNDVFIMNADGTDQTNLTSESPAPYNYSPAISPDNSKVVFMGGYSSGDDTIFLIDFPDTNISYLETAKGAARGTSKISWSPDGTKIVLDIFKDIEIRKVIQLLDLNTGEAIQLTNNSEDDNNPSWSFDGTKIAFRSRTPVQGIYSMDLKGENRSFLFDATVCLSPEFSPNDLTLVMQCRDDDWDLYLLDVSSGNFFQLTNYEGNEGSPSWSPDGEWIVFSSNMDDPNFETCSPARDKVDCNNEIYIIRTDGSNLKRLTFNEADDHDPDW